METAHWKVEGMDCNTCALSIHKYLSKKGLENVKVNFATGDVIFSSSGAIENTDMLEKGIADLGYRVVAKEDKKIIPSGGSKTSGFLKNNFYRFIFCLPFTLLLTLHMLPFNVHWLHNAWLQLALCIPVYSVGMMYFGKSAWKSTLRGAPNMNLLITIGATAAFVYSLYGTLIGQPDQFMFYETAATIITLVFFGNYLEEVSIASTQKQLKQLEKKQITMATMIAFDDEHQEQLFEIENTALRSGDLVLIKSGNEVPADCKILWGDGAVNEAIITGESLPIYKKAKEHLIGGSILVEGTVKAQITAAGADSILAGIVTKVKEAQGEKPPIQLLADKISAIFIPLVLGLALVTLIGNWIYLQSFTPALLRAIAVLVIACPCAMGLATPAAIAVGMGRAARNGILFRNASGLELFKSIKQIVFDKTGTLTQATLTLDAYRTLDGFPEENFKKIVYSLEKYSTHPIALSLVDIWKTKDEIRWNKVQEIKGLGIEATDKDGDTYLIGSLQQALAHGYPQTTSELLSALALLKNTRKPQNVDIFLSRNQRLVGWLSMKDEIRPEARYVIDYFKRKNIKPILLSGDKQEKCDKVAHKLGIDTVFANQTVDMKIAKIAALNSELPTAMIGDGINDAPALAKATIGISINDASQMAIASSEVVLMNNNIEKLPMAIGLGKATYQTIQQNLFWAFAYNVVAIPIAAFGLLTPAFAALAMGLSDVVLALNSIRLLYRKVDRL